ncbi:MAG: tRNA (guanosine(46)-N7)-methyltransferase TrmB [Bacteroidota bacterium]
MTKRKLQKFAELGTFENVFQPKNVDFIYNGFFLKGKWASEYFINSNPVILELGCGKGEYTTGLAEKYPGKNFIGIDIKGERLWKGSKTALDKKINNVAFIRTQIEHINYFFNKDEVSEIWITFPDPQPNKPKTKKRLISPKFLDRYMKILVPGGIIHLKTDNVPLFDYSLDVIKNAGHNLLYKTHDLYGNELIDDVLSIKTFYEKMFLEEGLPICYLKFQFNFQ